ncbi:MAG TPA: hypothetical protein P5120_07030 [Spirochaetota bacterium]|nr:hypothetical protein [Spirochaetota bacterium]HPJ42567.1 hypothetical protein [Spirochaetota bacterium]HPR36270.1 hypothetical protein [Spirochaetota bacterium]HRX47255.1 hypothetical protein [Spirochaetota bacterium]
MKVVHILKRIETIDNDIKELRKLEKSIARDKSFTTPIYMTIEKQINILLDERNKLLGLSISNPPANMVAALEGEEDAAPEPLHAIHEPQKPVKKGKSQPEKKKSAPAAAKPAAPAKKQIIIPDDDDIPMLTQDQIDAKFSSLKAEQKPEPKHEAKTDIKALKEEKEAAEDNSDSTDDTGIKLLDVALEKGTLNRKTLEKEKKVRFFRENFPAD